MVSTFGAVASARTGIVRAAKDAIIATAMRFFSIQPPFEPPVPFRCAFARREAGIQQFSPLHPAFDPTVLKQHPHFESARQAGGTCDNDHARSPTAHDKAWPALDHPHFREGGPPKVET